MCLAKYPAHLLRDRFVDPEAWFHEDQVHTLPLAVTEGRGRSDAEFAGFVAGGGHEARVRAGSADRDRLAALIRIVALFDRSVERVHINVNDFPLASVLGILTRIHVHDDIISGDKRSGERLSGAPTSQGRLARPRQQRNRSRPCAG